MASSRFLYNASTGRYVDEYASPEPYNGPPRWTSGSQPVVHSTEDQMAGWMKLALGVNAVALFGNFEFGKGKRGWDYIAHAARAIEEYSPGKVFRTFQVSHMLSGLESASLQNRFFSPEILSEMRGTAPGRAWLGHLERLTGRNISDIYEKGFRFEGGRLATGQYGGRTLLERAGIIRAPTGAGARFQEGYARSLAKGGVTDITEAFGQPVKYLDAKGKVRQELFMITGGANRAQASKRFLFGYGTSLAERINQLARAPFELPVISGIMKRIPIVNRLKFDVLPSSGLKTVGKVAAKLGLLLPATYMAYQELDHMTRKSSVLDDTIFAEGITAGIATAWTKGQVALSKTADFLGLHAYREWQESIAPGSTELSKLMAFPILGTFAGLGAGYLKDIGRRVSLRRQGVPLEMVSRVLEAENAFFRHSIYNRPVDKMLMNVLDDDLITLARERAAVKQETFYGKMASKISARQQKRGLVGNVARVFRDVTPSRMRWMIGAAIGGALTLPFLPGALIPGERPEELEALYSGEKRVAIRKGRWWEFGRSSYEGGRIDRYREHWYPRMLHRAKEKAIWGEDDPSPFRRWWIENFTYELEKKHYRDRPYPITGTAFEDVPFIGPLLAATIGKVFKPPKYMHPDKWMRSGEEGQDEYLEMPAKYRETTLPGELPKGGPISPYSTKGLIGEQTYRLTEMVGLPGFTMTAIKDAVTGTPDVFDQEMQLESARRMYGAEREYWDLELGGGLGTTELVRRLYPHRRRQMELYNPIRNRMPEWLPGAGERSPDFLHGDPYVKVAEGESRLPGPGYAAMHPELAGLDPEKYPIIHRFSILADVAPYTEKFKSALGEIRGAIARKELTAEEIATYKERMAEVASRKKKKQFTPYKYKERARTPMEELLAEANEGEKAEREESWFERTVGSYWETLTRSAETPFEYLTPISPASKLIHMRTAVEDYERTQVWGTNNAFWGHPIRDFFGPFFDSAKHALGVDGIPDRVKEMRDLEEYFDTLKYVKYTRLKRAAGMAKDTSAVKEYEDKRRETLFGIDPFTYNFSHIYRALPRRDRDYFNEFSEADMEERVQILTMIPENEQALMLARWKLKDSNDLKMAMKKGLLSEDQMEAADRVLEDLYEEKDTEGFPKNGELWAEYIATRLPGETYPDWYRRVYLLEQKLQGKPLPGPDWVGWHPAVDLDDVKLKIVQNEGKNAYDYDLWPDRFRAVARRPIISQATDDLLDDTPDPEELRENLRDLLSSQNITIQSLTVAPGPPGVDVDFSLSHDRTMDIRRMVRAGDLN